MELLDPDMRLDLGGIAKGYATEQAAQALEAAGYTGYALSIGGNVRVVGSKYADEPWISGIQNPNLSSESAFLAKVALKDQSLVTSGSYQRYFELDGYQFRCVQGGYYPKEMLCIGTREEDHEIVILYFYDQDLDFVRPDMATFLLDETCWSEVVGK